MTTDGRRHAIQGRDERDDQYSVSDLSQHASLQKGFARRRAQGLAEAISRKQDLTGAPLVRSFAHSCGWMLPNHALRGLGGLAGNRLLVLGWALEQELVRMENAVGSDLSGHDGLGFILKEVRLGTGVLDRDPIAG